MSLLYWNLDTWEMHLVCDKEVLLKPCQLVVLKKMIAKNKQKTANWSVVYCMRSGASMLFYSQTCACSVHHLNSRMYLGYTQEGIFEEHSIYNTLSQNDDVHMNWCRIEGFSVLFNAMILSQIHWHLSSSYELKEEGNLCFHQVCLMRCTWWQRQHYSLLVALWGHIVDTWLPPKVLNGILELESSPAGADQLTLETSSLVSPISDGPKEETLFSISHKDQILNLQHGLHVNHKS